MISSLDIELMPRSQIQSTLNSISTKIDRFLFPTQPEPVRTQQTLYIHLTCFLYLSGIYIWALAGMHSLLTNVIYLTLIGYTATWLYFGLALQERLWGHGSPSLSKYTQMIFQTALDVEVPITIVFWSFLFKIVLQSNASLSIILLNANLHAGPLICLILDNFFNSYDFYRPRVIVVVILGTVYMIINMAYSLAVTPIYRPIDWVSVLSYVLIFSCYGLVVGTHFLSNFLYLRYKRVASEPILTEPAGDSI